MFVLFDFIVNSFSFHVNIDLLIHPCAVMITI